MHIEAAEPRRGQNRPRQNQAVRGDHRGIGAERSEGGLLRFVPQGRRKADLKAALCRQRLNRRGLRPLSAAGGARWLRVDREDPVPGRDQSAQDRRGERGRAHENEVERLSRTDDVYAWPLRAQAAVAGTRLRLALASLRRIIPRFSEEI